MASAQELPAPAAVIAPAQVPPGQAAPPPQPWPAWLITLLVALAVSALGAAVWYFSPSRRAAGASAPVPAVALGKPEAAATPAKPHPYAKHLEITGIRVTEDKNRRLQIRFVVVNHSAAEMADVAGNAWLTAASTNKQVCSFAFKVPGSLGPYETREVTTTATTTLRAYEFPDWQFLKAEFQITSP